MNVMGESEKNPLYRKEKKTYRKMSNPDESDQ
jgi:hypothetical protein